MSINVEFPTENRKNKIKTDLQFKIQIDNKHYIQLKQKGLKIENIKMLC